MVDPELLPEEATYDWQSALQTLTILGDVGCPGPLTYWDLYR